MGSVIVFGSLYAKNLLNNNKRTEKQPPPPELPQYEKPEGS
ncbi:BnaCnng50880D [Brassica napus]|uniref:BnaCnng50880D protein n=2 Tax=Brassica TaxID=3705 RepID=A0A078JKX5_BRANA|nr:BnaCnng50880D [Brassica napus]